MGLFILWVLAAVQVQTLPLAVRSELDNPLPVGSGRFSFY